MPFGLPVMSNGLSAASARYNLWSLIDQFAMIWRGRSFLNHLSMQEDLRLPCLHCDRSIIILKWYIFPRKYLINRFASRLFEQITTRQMLTFHGPGWGIRPSAAGGLFTSWQQVDRLEVAIKSHRIARRRSASLNISCMAGQRG